MSLQTDYPTSRRGYLSKTELSQFANINVTDNDEADDVISQAEEMIDGWVGFQDKFMDYEVQGRVYAATANTITLQLDQQGAYDVDFFKGCEIEMLGGVSIGDRRKVTGSTKEGILTVDENWTTTPDTTSFYRIYQLGKFPRQCDVVAYSQISPTTYYKSIPEAVKRAVAAQVAYIIEMGDPFFSGDGSEKQSESIGDYSYTNRPGAQGPMRLIAPKARLLLRGIKNRVGMIV